MVETIGLDLRNLRKSPERLCYAPWVKADRAVQDQGNVPKGHANYRHTGCTSATADRKSLTQRLNRSASPAGWALKRLPALSGSLERTSHYTALPFAH